METRWVEDDELRFQISVWPASNARASVLFAAGGGGKPERHAPLLEALAQRGFNVFAPHFAMLPSPHPTDEILTTRARQLSLASRLGASVTERWYGVGHSLGATLLLAIAGAQLWRPSGNYLTVSREPELSAIVSMAAPTGHFQAPGALDEVRAALMVWTGTRDTLTPPAQALYLQQALEKRVAFELCVAEGAGHFSFMHTPPPNTTEPLPDREAFLHSLSQRIIGFLERRVAEPLVLP